MIARITGRLVSFPTVTKVAGWSTTTPAVFNPINPKKRPIPAAMASFCDLGMLLIIHALTGKILRIKNKIPETKTAARAICHLTPIPITTGKGEKSIQAHSRGHSDGIVGIEPHD